MMTLSNQSGEALILIDLQKEFLSPIGLFRDRHIPPEPLLSKVEEAVTLVRKKTPNSPIVWVRSEYDHKGPREVRRLQASRDVDSAIPQNDDFLASSHFGKRPCCPKNQTRTEFHDKVQSLLSPEDLILTKHWYSAWTETNLLTWLRERGVHTLWVGGVVSNVCVMATVCDAFFLGFTVKVLQDCVAATSPERHAAAMSRIQKYYGHLCQSEDIE